jgi:hypothetical protein
MIEMFSMRMAPTLGGKLVMIVSMAVYGKDVDGKITNLNRDKRGRVRYRARAWLLILTSA